MIDVLNDRSLAAQVFDGEIFTVFRNWSDTSNANWNQDAIFVYLKDIVMFEAFRNRDGACGREELKPTVKAISTVCNKFLIKEVRENVKEWTITYAYRDCYTFSNFWKHQDKWQWGLLPVFLFPFGVKWLAQYCYPDVSAEVMKKMSREYKAQEEVNAFVRDKFETTKDDAYLSLLSTKFSKVDELMKDNIQNRTFVSDSCYAIPGTFMAFINTLAGAEKTSCMMQKEEDAEWDKYSRLYRLYRFLVPVCVGTFTGGTSMLFAMVFGSYISDAIERPAFGMACVTGCYAAVVSLWNVTKMRTVREERIKISEISQLLKRTDIEIV